MNAAATFEHASMATCEARPRERTPSMAGRLAKAFRSWRRSRRAHAAFRDAYETLHRMDAGVLVDIGIRPEQLTVFARATAARPRAR